MTYLITTPAQLSHAIKSARKAAGLTQKEAGVRVGLLPKTISALENHPESTSIESLLKLLSVLSLELSLSPKAGATGNRTKKGDSKEGW